ncbi:MAG: histidine phosphatase family protein [Actinobacteria bacterium]|nr:histidine phosphatase family protein [Actinomycetota bacterium]
MTTLLLVRHGETDWNAERRWQGHADVPLNARGREQADALAEQLAAETIDAIYSSDLSRARDTALAVASRLKLPVVVDHDLREVDVGAIEGLTAEEARAFEGWQGEPIDQHAERVLRAVHRIADAHPGGRVLVVTHGGSMRRVHEHLGLDADGPFENCVVWACAYENGGLRALD